MIERVTMGPIHRRLFVLSAGTVIVGLAIGSRLLTLAAYLVLFVASASAVLVAVSTLDVPDDTTELTEDAAVWLDDVPAPPISVPCR